MSTPYDKPEPGQPPATPFPPGAEPSADEAPQVHLNGGGGGSPFAPQVMGTPPGSAFAPQVMGAPPGGATGSFAPQVMGAPPGGATSAFAPQVMGAPPGGATGSFAPQVMGAPPGGATGSFAPQVMGATGSFAPQVMGGAPAATPFAPPAMVAPVPVSPPSSPSLEPPDPPPPAMGAAIAGISNGGGVATPTAPGLVEPPAMSGPLAGAPAEDDGLAASPWNTANNPGFNRDLLPSAMVAAPEPAPASKRAARAVAPEVPSRTPWIIVGVLVLVAIAGGVAVFLIHGRQSGGGQIAVPAGGSTVAPDETAADTAAPPPTATVSATAARPVPTYRPVAPVVKPRPTSNGGGDDPYGDVRSRPAPSPNPGGRRIFGSDN